jgi:hypothetical protein
MMATAAAIARHWAVSSATAAAILERHGARPLRRGRGYYHWRDVWRVEGHTAPVPPEQHDAMTAPLLDKAGIMARYGVKERTARRWLADGTLPAIRLGERILRARASDLDRDDDRLLGVGTAGTGRAGAAEPGADAATMSKPQTPTRSRPSPKTSQDGRQGKKWPLLKSKPARGK